MKEESEKADLKLNIQKPKIIASIPSFNGKLVRKNNGNSDRLCFLGLQKSLGIVTTAIKLKDAWSLEEKL